MEVRHGVILDAARLADELGYEVISVAEGWGLDSAVVLAEIAKSTKRIRISAGVFSIWGRTAGSIAMTAATLNEISGGRFILGLGASTSALAQGFHGVPYERPAARLRDYTVGVRALLRGEPAPAGLGRPLKLGQPPVPDLPIWIAASGNRTVRVAAELADGWCPLYLRRDRLRDWMVELAPVRAAAGLGPLTLSAGPFSVADDDPDRARELAAACTARYLTMMGEIYPRVVSAQGLGAEVELVRAANSLPDGPRGVVPDQASALLTEFAAFGTPDDVHTQLSTWDKVTDITAVCLPPGLPWPNIEATLRAGAP
jgi:alkanesulfonate monooxygenase SsuD/methylene tetrahydromethanopterin reductase-like flavin-dependent oxidoreductase (luciferase family)